MPSIPPNPADPRVALLALLVVAELIALLAGGRIAAFLSEGAFVAVCLSAGRWMTLRERALLGIGAVATGVFLMHGHGVAALRPALDLAAYFATFILLLTLMKETAARSGAVLTVGRFLTSQREGRRFYATAFGGHFLGVFLNFGAVSLMAPLIQRGAAGADGVPDPALERRQLSALIRGFSWVLLWAPTTLSQAVLLTVFSDVAWSDFVWLGVGTAILMIVVGRLYDRLEWRNAPPPAPVAMPRPPYRAMMTVFAICAGLIGTTFAGSAYFDAPIATVLMIVAPVVTLGWFAAQKGAGEGPVGRMAAFGPVALSAAPALARAAIALGLSGYLGRLAAQILPTDQLGAWLAAVEMPGWIFLSLLPIAITLAGQVALSPILLVVFLGEVLKSVPALPAENVDILFALSAGWSLSMTASPNATATLLIASVTGVAPTTLTWRWNLRYGMVCYAVLVAIFWIIA